ncbi:DNA-binding response regulator, NarL/FixJ family, contains REC and HTH domains [Amycolatopsis arida]|uniref:DNA-binding response regulator, NarL/FixJ family, contains REC and HTH domains n=1 Tax=Amycolatopsis arida TaxID=587909 RepID=A0A1I5YE04_9PSEU|nr:response regulator transcription factor [Amycolatopsis arida]TDX90448.1 DNA-binding NarL/FixJ family response regulator [Amycolatopsis arida]SFQ42436.1 DNA-binding response regulator, NarL/FixJ family, contains REC and HTH domains [Amycolatopsis arida]
MRKGLVRMAHGDRAGTRRAVLVLDPCPISGLGLGSTAQRTLPDVAGWLRTGTAAEALGALRTVEPALVVTNTDPATALAFARRLVGAPPLLVLLPAGAHPAVPGALHAAGVAGLLPAAASPDELRVALVRTYLGRGYEHPAFRPAGPRRRALSRREQTVLELMAEGYTNEDIGRRLYLSTDTIRCHVRSVLSKLHADNRTHAVALGYRLGMLPLAGEPVDGDLPVRRPA